MAVTERELLSNELLTIAPQRLGIDEKAFKKGHDYVTVICDQVEGVLSAVSAGGY